MEVRVDQLREYYEAMQDYDADQLDELLWQHPLAPYTNGDSEMIVSSCYKAIQAFDAAKLDELLWRYPLALYTKGESEFGPTPTLLHEAAHRGAVGCARLLLERGADKDAKDRHGCTPLHLAVMRCNETRGTYNSNHLAVVEVLLEKGADKDAVNDSWLTPRDLTKDPIILKVLRYWPPPQAMRRNRRILENATPPQKGMTPSAGTPTPSECRRKETREEEEPLYVDGEQPGDRENVSARAPSVQPSIRCESEMTVGQSSVKPHGKEAMDKNMGQLVKLQKTQVIVTAFTAFLFFLRQQGAPH